MVLLSFRFLTDGEMLRRRGGGLCAREPPGGYDPPVQDLAAWRRPDETGSSFCGSRLTLGGDCPAEDSSVASSDQGPGPSRSRNSEQASCAMSERHSCITAQNPVCGGTGGRARGEVPRYSDILVERMATIISPMKSRANGRVRKPATKARPPTISSTAIAGASVSGMGIPSLVNRPTPWFTKTNLITPSQKNTHPAIRRIQTVALGAAALGRSIH